MTLGGVVNVGWCSCHHRCCSCHCHCQMMLGGVTVVITVMRVCWVGGWWLMVVGVCGQCCCCHHHIVVIVKQLWVGWPALGGGLSSLLLLPLSSPSSSVRDNTGAGNRHCHHQAMLGGVVDIGWGGCHHRCCHRHQMMLGGVIVIK